MGLVIDNFAGGGGASEGIKWAIGRDPDAALNHDPEAVAMHKANHPNTRHYCQNIWQVDPRDLVSELGGGPVDLVWFSPDCKHFSKAKGAAPVKRNVRDLAWVVVQWAEMIQPEIIMLENVEEFRTWGPVCIHTNKPIKERAGETFDKWVRKLRRAGYKRIEFQELPACDYGAPTIRKRLFMIARRDGKQIVWPDPSHGPEGSGLAPYRTAADCIDWSIPCLSIFERERPLAENTLKRIAKGIQKFVVDAEKPFIVSYYGPKKEGDFRGQDIEEPLKTQTTENRHALVTPFVAKTNHSSKHYDAFRGQKLEDPLQTVTRKNGYALISPFIGRIGQTGSNGHRGKKADQPLSTVTSKAEHLLVSPHLSRQFGKSIGSGGDEPLGTVTAGGGGKTALVSAFMAKHYGGVTGVPIDQPAPTTTTRGTQNQVVTSHLIKLKGTCRHGQKVDVPMPTIQAGGNHVGEVRAFLLKYYGTNTGSQIDLPMHSVTTKDRFGLVTIEGVDYQIVDIGMRMLQPRELFRAQGFDDDYKIDIDFNGKKLTKTAQVRMCGNSVSPYMSYALVSANYANDLAHAAE